MRVLNLRCMIKEINIEFKNCFGTKNLVQKFSFKQGQQVHLLYAPNGSMKTSFAKTMKYLSGQDKKNKPCDLLQCSSH